MTIDEAIYCMKMYLPDADNEACVECPYYESKYIEENFWTCQSGTAHQMAIDALSKIKDATVLFDALESLRVDIDVDGFGRSQSEIKRYESMNNVLDDCIRMIRGWLESGNNQYLLARLDRKMSKSN